MYYQNVAFKYNFRMGAIYSRQIAVVQMLMIVIKLYCEYCQFAFQPKKIQSSSPANSSVNCTLSRNSFPN